MSDIAPCLWVATGADAAAAFYVSVFRDAGRSASIDSVTRWGAGHAAPQDAVLMVQLKLSGQELHILAGGQAMPSSPAISLIVKCRDQADVDHFWARLA